MDKVEQSGEREGTAELDKEVRTGKPDHAIRGGVEYGHGTGLRIGTFLYL